MINENDAFINLANIINYFGAFINIENHCESVGVMKKYTMPVIIEKDKDG
jgi:hypothetical protein